jgi:membrane-associated protein
MTLHDIVTFLTDERALEALMQGAWGQGVVVVAVILLIETGVVFMPFLPGDSWRHRTS